MRNDGRYRLVIVRNKYVIYQEKGYIVNLYISFRY